MCQGDDLNCPHFKLHYEKFKEGLDIERRTTTGGAFLAYTAGQFRHGSLGLFQ